MVGWLFFLVSGFLVNVWVVVIGFLVIVLWWFWNLIFISLGGVLFGFILAIVVGFLGWFGWI